MTPHYASDLLFLPYPIDPADDGQGPHTFNCWGLVRHFFLKFHDIAIPLVRVKEHGDHEAEIRDVARIAHFYPTKGQPQDLDILLMWGPYGRHVAVALDVDGGIFVLHSMEGSGVVSTPLCDLILLGYRDVTIWRRT